jgi:hypothetical protein
LIECLTVGDSLSAGCRVLQSFSTILLLNRGLLQTTVIAVYIIHCCQRIVAEQPVFDGQDCAGGFSILEKQGIVAYTQPQKHIRRFIMHNRFLSVFAL